MAKITSKASLISLQASGNNLILHLVDKGGTNVAITKGTVDGSGNLFVITGTGFTTASTTNGITNRAIVPGDIIKLSHTNNAANEGLQIKVTTVTATQIDGTTNGITQIGSITGASETAGSDINITAFKKTYEFVEVGALDFVDGVQGIILASKLVDMWNTSDLDKYDRVFASIEPRAKSIASINGWEPHNSDTLNAIRDTALEIRPSASGAATKIYALFRSTSDANAPTDQMTYWYGGDAALTAPNNFVMTGYANQLALIYDDNNGSPIDKRGSWYTRLAVEYKTIVMQEHTVRFAEIYPISAANALDPKLTIDDDVVSVNADFTGITYNVDGDGTWTNIPLTTLTGSGSGAIATITVTAKVVTNVSITTPGSGYAANDTVTAIFGDTGSGFVYTVNTVSSGGITTGTITTGGTNYAGNVSGTVDVTSYTFKGYIQALSNGSNQTNENIHHRIHYLLRQSTNINADATGPTLRGDKQWPITSFSGDVFTVEAYIQNYRTSQRNNLRLVDVTGTSRSWPVVYTLSVKGTGLAIGGTFSVIHEDSFGTSNAIYLVDDQAVQQKDKTITADTGITVAYSTYTNGGHTANTPLALRLTYNRPGFIEPDSTGFVLSGDTTVTIQPTADPSYTAA